MRRPITALAGTVAGIALLVGLKVGTSGPPVNGVQTSARDDVPNGKEQRSDSDESRGSRGDDGDGDDSRSPRTRRPKPRTPRTTPALPGLPGGNAGNGGTGGNAGNGGTGGGTGGNNCGGGTGGGTGTGGGAGGGTGGGTGTGGGGTGTGGGAGGGTGKSGTFVGTASSNPYGTIRVTITVANGKMTGVSPTFPTSPSTTAQINARAIPKLKQEALAAQSARIAAVSGATYTSGSFKASLQSALTKAGI